MKSRENEIQPIKKLECGVMVRFGGGHLCRERTKGKSGSPYHRTINNIFLPSEAMSDSENQPEKEAEVEKKVIGSALFQY